MSGFIEWLEELNQKDTRIRAVLRRGLSFEPGAYPSAYPYVEPFVKGEENGWRRDVHYLVAGLWAQHWRGDRVGAPETLSRACLGYYRSQENSPSVERRFISLLDSDGDQLTYRLRQMTVLLKEYPLDFPSLLKDLLSWNHDKKWVQNKWAREFYSGWDLNNEDDDNDVSKTKEEVK